MTHSFTDLDSARGAGMTALHGIWFGSPVSQRLDMLPGMAPTGGLIASADDMAS